MKSVRILSEPQNSSQPKILTTSRMQSALKEQEMKMSLEELIAFKADQAISSL